jgi:1-acyl-sn-glycerol-3-phosphate acyltransferase
MSETIPETEDTITPDHTDTEAATPVHTDAEAATPKNADIDIATFLERYPVRRGIQGYIGYALGITASKILIKLRAEGLENIPANAPYVMSPNHVTYVDGMWVTSFLPRHHFKLMCCMAAKELEDSHGWIGRLIMKVGRGIAADRFGNPVRALILAKKQLEIGQILLVHPEGTRSPDGKVGELKDGASYLAIKAHCPLLPIYIHGGYEVFNRHFKFPKPFDCKNFRRKRVTIYYGKPLMPENFKKACDMTAALTAWMNEMQEKALSGQL